MNRKEVKIIMNKRIASILASGAMLFNVVGPVAATELVVSGNGDSSTSNINFNVNGGTSVTQSNTADVYNEVHASASTGNNDASRNTGGAVTVDTGDAETDVAVTNSVNSNVAEVDCCATLDNVDILIDGNGADTTNSVDLDMNDDEGPAVSVEQWNVAELTNKVHANADTGRNNANRNTGADVSVDTGSASTGVALLNTANANSARVGGEGDGETEVSLRILGNGDSSDNDIELDLGSLVELQQANYADVYNFVDADATTGRNDANRNTGGDVMVDTGDAEVDVLVDNMVNFNAADVDCGCMFDVLAKIDSNGSDSDNDIVADLGTGLEVGQFNGGQGDNDVTNKVHANADTGWNDANRNTGEVDADSDPSVTTGNSDVDVQVGTTGNSNLFGDGFDMDFEFPGSGFNFNFSFDIEDLMDALEDLLS